MTLLFWRRQVLEGFPQRNKGQMGSGHMIYELFCMMYVYCILYKNMFLLYHYMLSHFCMLLYTYAWSWLCTSMIIHISNAGSASKSTLQFEWDEIPWDEIHSPNLSMLRCYYSILPQWNVNIELYIQDAPIRSMYGTMLTFIWFILW